MTDRKPKFSPAQSIWSVSAFGLALLFYGVAPIALAVEPPECPAPSILRVSVATGGAQGSGGEEAEQPSISANGTRIAFRSYFDDLVPGFGGHDHIYVHDIETVATYAASRSSDGVPGNSYSTNPQISGNGLAVVFSSLATNLVPNDTNDEMDLFWHSLETGETLRVNVSSAGVVANAPVLGLPSITQDGRYVAFSSAATNLIDDEPDGTGGYYIHDTLTRTTVRALAYGGRLSADGDVIVFSTSQALVPGDTNGLADVYVFTRSTGDIERVSLSSSGGEPNRLCTAQAISSDGRFVAFLSQATNLVPGQQNFEHHIYLRDRATGITTRESVSSGGILANSSSSQVSVSDDGRFVAFYTTASTLVPGVTDFYEHVYLRDRELSTTRIVDLMLNGLPNQYGSFDADMSADGRYITFASHSSSLVPDDTNNVGDTFVAPNRAAVVLAGDANGDRIVDFQDLNTVLAFYGQPAGSLPIDPNGDGVVDFADLNAVLSSFGQSCQ